MSVDPKYDFAKRALDAIIAWWKLRESDSADYEVMIDGVSRFKIEAEHSLRAGLLRRLLVDEMPPLQRPPPCAYSRPWYSLVDKGEGKTLDLFPMDSFDWSTPPAPGDQMAVAQSAGWTLVEYVSRDEVVISHPGVGTVRALRMVQRIVFSEEKTVEQPYWELKVLSPLIAAEEAKLVAE